MEPITSHPHHDHQVLTINIMKMNSAPTDDHDPHHHQHSFYMIASRSIIPKLVRFHAGYFRISMSLGSQALLWKSLIIGHNNTLIFPTAAFMSLWSFSLLNLVILSLVYLLRCLFLPHMVKAEFLHHVGVNYLFAPWISWLLLLQCAPGFSSQPYYLGLWWLLVLPLVALDLKIYGRWFTTKGQRHTLIVVANPTCQMSVIGNLVGSRAAAEMGCKETAMFMFSLGMVHYLVLFVTLYQSRDTLPAELKPVVCLLFAAPGVASLAWSSIAGRFDTLAKMLFFLSLFLFMCLVGRVSELKRAMRRLNVTWWAYPFPVTVIALAATEYAEETKGIVADVLMLLFVSLSLLLTLLMIFFTLFNNSVSLLLPQYYHHHYHDGHYDYDSDYHPVFKLSVSP